MNHADGGGAVRRWVSDLAFGFRLSVGGSRHSGMAWIRLAVGAVGVALAVALLLGAASVGNLLEARDTRQAAWNEDTQPRPGVSPTYSQYVSTEFRDEHIVGVRLHGSGPTAPVPPGLARLPHDGELIVSPALAQLLDSADGELLRPRFEGLRRTGTIADSALVEPEELRFYTGADGLNESGVDSGPVVYAYGAQVGSEPLPIELTLLIALGVVALLIPVLMFVVSSSRIAGAERDRRLSAIRLVGADAAQVRRIAAAETLPPVFAGMLLGVALFLLGRPIVSAMRPFDIGVFAGDITPYWPMVLLIALGLPLGSVITSMASSRRTVVEPLGVVRLGKPRRRRLWWRLVVLALGVGVLFCAERLGPRDDEARAAVVVVGACLLLIGLATLLPWGVDTALARVRGGAPSWQLAVRRLQLDGGTASRVISGVVMVLAGAIALQITIVSVAEAGFEPAAGTTVPDGPPGVVVYGDLERRNGLTEDLARVPGVGEVHSLRTASVRMTGPDHFAYGAVADCGVLRRYADVGSCSDGDTFIAPFWVGEGGPGSSAQRMALHPGQRVTFQIFDRAHDGDTSEVRWTVPETARELDQDVLLPAGDRAQLLVTPGALGAVLERLPVRQLVAATDGDPDVVERVRNAVGMFSVTWLQVRDANEMSLVFSGDQRAFAKVRTALLAGALFVILVAALSMLVLGVEQVRERRRALAAVSASGVGYATLARSLLWQNTVPMAVGVVLAMLGGGALAALVMRLIHQPMVFDWAGIGLITGAAGALTLVVTLLSLPALRAAVSVRNLRTE